VADSLEFGFEGQIYDLTVMLRLVDILGLRISLSSGCRTRSLASSGDARQCLIAIACRRLSIFMRYNRAAHILQKTHAQVAVPHLSLGRNQF
jgi:hypothetical protein